MGVIRFNNETKRAYLASYHPGLTPEVVAQNTGFQLDISQAVETESPTEEETRILRDVVDPEGVFLQRYVESG
jgi:glutaconate CoA-transferase subunit B